MEKKVKRYEVPGPLGFDVQPFAGQVHLMNVASLPGTMPEARMMGSFYVIVGEGIWQFADRYHAMLANQLRSVQHGLEREARERALFENTMLFLRAGYTARVRIITKRNTWGVDETVYDWIDPWGRIFLEGSPIREERRLYIRRDRDYDIPFVPLGTEFAQPPIEEEEGVE